MLPRKRRILTALGSSQGGGTPGETVLGDHELFTVGPYSAWMDPYNTTGLTFTDSMTVRDAEFPDNTDLTWSYPLPGTDSIKGFLQVAGYGDYYDTVPQTPIVSQQLKNITALTATHDLTHSGTANGYNVIYDGFLTVSAGHSNQAFEYEIFIHSPQFAIDYFTASYVSQIASSVSLSGYTWDIAVDGTAMSGSRPIILFMPSNRADIDAATIDCKALFDYLIGIGILTGNEFWNGGSLGVEPARGSGTLHVTDASDNYAADWRPLADDIGNALVDLDFENSRFYFNGTTYTTFAAVLAAIGAGSNNGDGTYTLGPNSNLPFAGYNTSEGTVVCEYINSAATSNTFAWTIQQSGSTTDYWRLLARNGSNLAQMDVFRTNALQASLVDSSSQFSGVGTRFRTVSVMKTNDFATYANGEHQADDTAGLPPVATTSVSAQIFHRAGAGKLGGTGYRWAYFPRALALEQRSLLALRSSDLITGIRSYFSGPSHAVEGGQTWVTGCSSKGSVLIRRKGQGSIVLRDRLQTDDHNDGGILKRSSDSRYIMRYCPHGSSANYFQRISTNPNDLTSWGTETNFGASIGATAYSYTNLFEITDGIIDFPRATASGDSYFTWGYTLSTDNGATTGPWVKLFAEPNQRSYARFSKRGANQIDCICNDGHPAEFTLNQNSTYHLYYDAGAWKKSDGTALGATPYRPQTVLTKVWDAVAQGQSSWVSDVQSGPVCVFAVYPTPGTDHRYRYADWNGSAWTSVEICTAGGTLYPVGDNSQQYYFGGVIIDPDDTNIIYCSRETGTGGPHRNGGWFQIWKGVRSTVGGAFTMTQLTFGKVDCIRPKKDAGSKVTYARGVYTSYTNYNTEMCFLP